MTYGVSDIQGFTVRLSGDDLRCNFEGFGAMLNLPLVLRKLAKVAYLHNTI